MKKGLITLTLAVAFVLSVLAITSGCGVSASAVSATELSVDKYDQITVGMTADQLKSIAGEPAKIESRETGSSMPGMQMDSSNMDYWYYQGAKGWLRIELADGKVTDKSGY